MVTKMPKPLVFISHITSEKELAQALRELIQTTFMGMIEVFVSSDPDSIAMGGRWLEEITRGLKNCVVEVVLASPQSIKRPWINFEAGAGWVRDIAVIPVCHSGMTPDGALPPCARAFFCPCSVGPTATRLRHFVAGTLGRLARG